MRFTLPSKDSPVYELIDSVYPEWAKLGTYKEIRRSVLDSPKRTISNRRRYIRRYAIFCATVPYVLVSSLIWIGDHTGVLPPTKIEQQYADIARWEKDLVRVSTKFRRSCEEFSRVNLDTAKRCTDWGDRY